MQDQSAIKPLVFGFLAAFCWGTHSVIVRYLTGDMQGITIAALRLYIAAAVLFVLMKILHFPVSSRLSDRNLQIAAGSTVVNYICFHIGLEYTSASNAMMLENTAPFFVLLILFLLAGETVRRRDILATLIALFGVFLTVLHDIDVGGEGLHGDLLELAAGLSWAGFIIGSSRALRASASTAERVNFLFNVFICSAIVLTPLMLIYPGSATANDVALLVLLGLFPTALAYYLWYEAASRVSAVSAALLFTLSVICNCSPPL
ncbi:DMT family transporter [Hoeflea sp.]|uniref:DMT family transporter n=1 Tax=Hoeflea sp. TaxID=1940281 RepID=UPI003B011E98